MRISRLLLSTLLIAALANGARTGQAAETQETQDVSPEAALFFKSHIQPLLAEKCLKCHGEEKQSGNLRLDSRGGFLLGGDSGPALVPGQPGESLLIEAIKYESYEMPPDGQMSDDQIALFTKWVELGAPWPGDGGETPEIRTAGPKITDEDRAWWAFQPLSHPQPPHTDSDWAKNDIDRFILAKLHEAELSPQPIADRLTLIRRATQIVTGLPPTIEEIDAFLSDEQPGAYERLVDRLLESPRRGEHLARFWLDLVRYAESDGYRADGFRPNSWRYRDYVVRSFNEDKPYDLFMMEQIAGDELAPHNPDALIATGYYRHGVYEYNQRDAEGQWKAMMEDVTDTSADVFLAMGMGCAKCHDHKFDPILQTDYYQLQAFFSNIAMHDETPAVTPDELREFQRRQAEWEAATADIRAELAKLEQPKLDRLNESAVKMFTPELQAMWRKPDAERTSYERQIAWLIEEQAEDARNRLDSQFKGEEKERRDELRKQLAEFDKLKPAPLPTARTASDISLNPAPLYVPGRDRLGEMQPGFLTVLDEPAPQIEPPAEVESTGRRAALAKWLATPDHPLVSRVIVNRIWQQSFGTGIVSTVSDFGRLGEKPSHPELLDWLASEFVSRGWSIKRLQREILLSATFQQASLFTPDAAAPVDPMVVDHSNRLLWRYPIRRLGGEQIRDAMLAASGEIDLKSGGAGDGFDSKRRSVYLKVLRNDREDILDAFDFPDRITSAGERNTTTTPTQSLLMINSAWTIQQAAALAKRVEREVGGGDDSRIRLAYRLAFGRDPSEQELLRAGEFMQQRRDAVLPGVEIASKSMLLTGSPAAALGDTGDRQPLQLTDADVLPQADFTIEAVVLLDSLYSDASVRTIASHWNSDTRRPGWSLGVTSEKSAYKPRNLILQLIGNTSDGKLKYEVLPSNIHLELARPYYIACSVKVSETGPTGVTFHVRDLLEKQGRLQSASVPHEVVSGFHNDGALVIGGRHRADRHRWDGLLDDVRLTKQALNVEQLLPASRREASASAAVEPNAVVGHWTFDSKERRLADSSPHGRTLSRIDQLPESDAPLVDLCHVLLNANEFLYID